MTSQTIAWLLQLRWEQEDSSWIASRSLIDICAYAALAAERGATPLEHALLGELEASTRVLLVQPRYDILVYLPRVLALRPDDFRDADPRFQGAVDARIQLLLADWGIEHLPLDPRAPDAVEQVLVRVAREETSAPE